MSSRIAFISCLCLLAAIATAAGTCDYTDLVGGNSLPRIVEFPESLPYPFDALEPSISAITLQTHFGAHQRGYVTKLNAWLSDDASMELLYAVDCKHVQYVEEGSSTPLRIVALHQQLPDKIPKAVYNLAAQVFNHALYFASLTGSPTEATADHALQKLVVRQFGSWDNFASEFKKRAIAHFGSGWVWLLHDTRGQVLHIVDTHDAEVPFAALSGPISPIVPLLVCDVWEHAYYLDYKNLRDRYYDGWWSKVDWKRVEARFTSGKVEGASIGGYPSF